MAPGGRSVGRSVGGWVGGDGSDARVWVGVDRRWGGCSGWSTGWLVASAGVGGRVGG